MNQSQRGFELLQAGDADGLRRLLDETPGAAEARPPPLAVWNGSKAA